MTKEIFEHLLEKTDFFMDNVKRGVIPENFNVPENSARKRKVQFFSLIDRCILELFLEYGRHLAIGSSESQNLKRKIEKFYLCRSKLLSNNAVKPDNIFYDLIYNNNLADYIFLLMTHSCQLRCQYCMVEKYNADTSYESIQNLFSAIAECGKRKTHIQFFGGEPFLSFPMMRKTVELAENFHKTYNMEFTFGVNSNGIDINEEKCAFCAEKKILLHVSCDGTEKTCSLSRHTARERADYKAVYKSIMTSLERLNKMSVPHNVVMVVSPETLPYMKENYNYLKSLGHKNIIINYAVGSFWTTEDQNALIKNMYELQKEAKNTINQLGIRTEPVTLNSQILYDSDGSIYGITAFFLKSDVKRTKTNFLVSEKLSPEVFFIPKRSQADSLWHLLSIYEKDQYSLKILMNNVELGMKLKQVQTLFSCCK